MTESRHTCTGRPSCRRLAWTLFPGPGLHPHIRSSLPSAWEAQRQFAWTEALAVTRSSPLHTGIRKPTPATLTSQLPQAKLPLYHHQQRPPQREAGSEHLSEQSGGARTFPVIPDLPMWPSEISRLVVLGVSQTLGLCY